MLDIECVGDEDYSTLRIGVTVFDKSLDDFNFEFEPCDFQQLMDSIKNNLDYKYENDEECVMNIFPCKRCITFVYNDAMYTFSKSYYNNLMRKLNHYFKIFERNEWYVHETD